MRSRTKPKAGEVAAWILLRLLDWHRPSLNATASTGGMEGAERKVRFVATLDGTKFCVTVEEIREDGKR